MPSPERRRNDVVIPDRETGHQSTPSIPSAFTGRRTRESRRMQIPEATLSDPPKPRPKNNAIEVHPSPLANNIKNMQQNREPLRCIMPQEELEDTPPKPPDRTPAAAIDIPSPLATDPLPPVISARPRIERQPQRVVIPDNELRGGPPSKTVMAIERLRIERKLEKNARGETLYAGRILIGKDTPIQGGVSIGSGHREAIVVDDMRDKMKNLDGLPDKVRVSIERVNSAYDAPVQAIQDMIEQMPETDDEAKLKAREAKIIKRVYKEVKNRMKWDNNAVLDIADRYALNDDQKVNLGVYVRKGFGVCRHQALYAGYIIERLIKDGTLPGSISVERNATDRGGHAWATYTTSSGEKIIIDPAQKYVGPPGQGPQDIKKPGDRFASKKGDRWDRVPGDRRGIAAK